MAPTSDTVRFDDRADAARQLAAALGSWRGSNPVVAAIPRGAVAMGLVLADALDGELDVVLTRKLGAPGNPELAIGAVDETGWVHVADYAGETGATPEYIERETRAQLETIRRRRAMYSAGRAPVDATGRVVIVVDDGLATGATMIAALHAMRARASSRLICAVPVASAEAARNVARAADEIVALRTPIDFSAVGQFYRRFEQVDDAEVVALLREAAPRKAARGARPDESR